MASIYDLMCRDELYLEGYKRAVLDCMSRNRDQLVDLLNDVNSVIKYQKYK